MVNKPLVIGITGAFGSGKTTAADFFETHGLKKIGLSSFLKEILFKKGNSLTRENYQDLGNKLRDKNGPGYLAELALERIFTEKIEKATVEGIRNLEEIEVLRKKTRFVLLGVVADRKTRFERIRKMPEREELSYDEFDKLDRRDLGLTEENRSGLQVAKCLALSDYFVESNDEEKYPKKLKEILRKL